MAIKLHPALQEYIERQYGGRFSATPVTVSVGLTASRIVQNNFERVALVLVNLSAGNVYVGLDPTVSPTGGIKLGSNGGLMSLNVKDDLVLVGNSWYAVNDTVVGPLYLVSVVRHSNE